MNGLPSFGYQVRCAHFITKTPRQKTATPLFGFAHPPPKTINQKNAIFLLKKGYLCR